jgi:hypothetical protein
MDVPFVQSKQMERTASKKRELIIDAKRPTTFASNVLLMAKSKILAGMQPSPPSIQLLATPPAVELSPALSESNNHSSTLPTSAISLYNQRRFNDDTDLRLSNSDSKQRTLTTVDDSMHLRPLQFNDPDRRSPLTASALDLTKISSDHGHMTNSRSDGMIVDISSGTTSSILINRLLDVTKSSLAKVSSHMTASAQKLARVGNPDAGNLSDEFNDRVAKSQSLIILL